MADRRRRIEIGDTWNESVVAADVDNYVSVDLSYVVMQQMRNRATTNNRGLYLTNSVASNWTVYMREHLTGGEAKLTGPGRTPAAGRSSPSRTPSTTAAAAAAASTCRWPGRPAI